MIGGQVQHGDLVAGLPTHRCEVADHQQAVTGRRDLDLDHVGGAAVVHAGDRDVHLGRQCARGGVQAGQVRARLATCSGEQPAGVQLAARQTQVADDTVEARRIERGDECAVGHVDAGDLAAIDAVDRVEVTADVDRRAVTGRDDRGDVAAQHWSEVGVDQTSGGVERRQVRTAVDLAAVR